MSFYKVCSKCGISKTPSEFYAVGRVCKECKKAYSKNYYKSKQQNIPTPNVDNMQETLDKLCNMIESLKTDLKESKFYTTNIWEKTRLERQKLHKNMIL